MSNWNTVAHTYTQYDALSRPITTTVPNGEQQVNYWIGAISSQTSNGRNNDLPSTIHRWQVSDWLGNPRYLRNWRRINSTTWSLDAEVMLTYDALGNLTKVEGSLSPTVPSATTTLTTITYDLGGRKTSMTDVDLGTWSYSYDRHSRLTRQVDGRGKVICLSYEATLGRLVAKDFRTGSDSTANCTNPTNNLTFGYDAGHNTATDYTASRSRGQLTSVSYVDGSYAKSMTYNLHGLLASETVTIQGAGQSFTTAYTYDSAFRLSSTEYPKLANEVTIERVVIDYNSMSLPRDLFPNFETPPFIPVLDVLVDNVNYDEAGRLTAYHINHGDLWRTQSYYPWQVSGTSSDSNGRLEAIKVGTTNGGNDRLQLVYGYDSFGNVKSYSEKYNGGVNTGSTLTYDGNNRLTAAHGNSYSYDGYGRLTAYEGIGYTGYRGHGITHLTSSQRYYYDGNGNVVNRRWGLGNQQTLTWDHENRLSQVDGGNGYSEWYRYAADGQRVSKTNNLGGVTYYVSPSYEATNETVWVDDALPGGALSGGDGDSWTWESGNAASGRAYHNSAALAGIHQHYFYNAKETVQVGTGDTLYAYVYLDPANPPQEVMLQWHDTLIGWEHRAYWGQNLIPWGTDGTVSRRYMGSLPTTGGWVRLEVPAALVGLEGKTIHGMAFTLHGGQAWWDRAGVRHAGLRTTKYYYLNGDRIAMRRNGVLTYLHSDHLGSVMLATDASGNAIGDHGYAGYGKYRLGSELGTDHRYTGQKSDGTNLQYFNARYYDPELGTFISPDTLVPNPTNVFDYNRYMYARGNPMKYTDPSGHVSTCDLENLSECENSETVGGTTSTINVNTITATTFGPTQLSTEEIIEQTTQAIIDQLQNMVMVYNKDGTVDWNATIGNSVLSELTDCAKLAGGVCGFSLGGSAGVIGGVRGSLDFYVDQEGHWDSFGTIGGGGYLPPLALISGGAALTHIETSKLTVAAIRNASINDMRGWSGQFGFNVVAGHGIATEWLVGRNSAGEYWHGLSIGSAQGMALDVHVTTTYSWSGRDIAGQTVRMIDQLRVTK